MSTFAGSDPQPKRKNDDNARGRRNLLMGACAALGAVLLAIGVYLLRPRFTLMSDVPRHDLIYMELGEVYTVDFQTGQHSTTIYAPDGIAEPKKISPDGRWEIRLQWLEVGKVSWLLLEDLTGQESLRVLGKFGIFYGSYNTMNWSPDQQWVAFSAYDYNFEADMSKGDYANEIWMVNIPTGEIKRLSSNTYLDTYPSFSPDGTQLAYISAPDGVPRVYVMDIATGKSRLLTPDVEASDPMWSPDGQWIAYETWYRRYKNLTDYTFDSHLYVIRVDGTHNQAVTSGEKIAVLLGWKS